MSLPPDFARFAAAFQQARYGEALAYIDALIGANPDAAALHWHRANCLEKLERWVDLGHALDRVLALKPDYVPAIVKRVQFSAIGSDDDYDDEADDRLSEAERERRDVEQAAQAHALSLRNEADLRRALAIEPGHVDALLLLSNLLRYRGDGVDHGHEADLLLARAIEQAPMRIDLLEARANHNRSAALRSDDGPDDTDTVRTFAGLRYRRSRLEAAIDDYDTCLGLSGEYRFAVRIGTLLHDLGRYNEALEHFDIALAKLGPEDPARAYIIETRARSENNGAGEREQMARMIESAVRGDGKDRQLGEDVAAQALLSAAQAVRAGRPLADALEARIGDDDPDLLMATSIAQQILNIAHEPSPGLVAVDSGEFPSYQRKFAERAAREAQAIGLRHIGDAEAQGMFLMLGQRVLLRFFGDDSGEIGVASFAMKPKWPGLVGFLILLLTGKWKAHAMLECVTQFDDGTLLSTQHESPSPFEYGGTVAIERLPKRASLRELLARHAERVVEHKWRNPGSVAMVADDIDGVERRWIEGQRAKRDYRTSIGYVTDAELKRLLGAQHERFGAKVRSQLAMLAEERAEHG
jgi:tetratricopeptide (TPR) repeat protein